MLFWILFALFTTSVILFWGFFLIARIHVYKFREYSTRIVPVTNLVFFVLLIVTFLGYIIVFLQYGNTTSASTSVKTKSLQETY